MGGKGIDTPIRYYHAKHFSNQTFATVCQKYIFASPLWESVQKQA